MPGPVCYAQGGTEPTITDANVVLGRLNPENFLGGEVRLDADLAQRALTGLGDQLGLGPEATAQAVLDIAVENIAEAMRLLTVRRGLDPRRFSLVAFGGAGPLHAAAIAKVIGARRVLILAAPGSLLRLRRLAGRHARRQDVDAHLAVRPSGCARDRRAA